MTDDEILKLADGCCDLRAIDLSTTLYNETEISDTAIIRIGKKCRNLRSLNLYSMDRSFSDLDIIQISEGCPDLCELDLICENSNSLITDAAIIKIA